jgi:hypothetical protein
MSGCDLGINIVSVACALTREEGDIVYLLE